MRVDVPLFSNSATVSNGDIRSLDRRNYYVKLALSRSLIGVRIGDRYLVFIQDLFVLRYRHIA